MKKFKLTLLPLLFAALLAGCEEGGKTPENPLPKKLDYARAEYAGAVDGTELHRYILTVYSYKNEVRTNNFADAGVELKMELITTKPDTEFAIVSGEYKLSSEVKANTVLASSNSSLKITDETTYMGDESLLSEADIKISYFNGKYEVSGTVTDSDEHELEFTFYDRISFDGDIVLPNAVKMEYGEAEYLGVQAGTDLHRYLVKLYSDTPRTRTSIECEYVVSLEILTEEQEEENTIADGKYLYKKQGYEAGTITNTTNTYYSMTDAGSEKANIFRVVAASVEIEFKDGSYSIAGFVDDANKNMLDFEFDGELKFPQEPEPEPLPDGAVKIDFEEVELSSGHTGYSDVFWGYDLSEEVYGNLFYNGLFYTKESASFGTYYMQYPGGFDVWGGFAMSARHDKTDYGTADLSNQFSVYASQNTTFAVCYYSGAWGEKYGTPIIEFSEPVTMHSADMANTSKLYHYCVAYPEVEVDDDVFEDTWVDVIVKGYINDQEVSELTIRLADGKDILIDWKNVDFSSLGEVDKLIFSMDSNDSNEYGMLAPAFFCIDNIVYQPKARK